MPAVTDLAECGTPAAYRRHLRYHEQPDHACLDANTAASRSYRVHGTTRPQAAAGGAPGPRSGHPDDSAPIAHPGAP